MAAVLRLQESGGARTHAPTRRYRVAIICGLCFMSDSLGDSIEVRMLSFLQLNNTKPPFARVPFFRSDLLRCCIT